MQKVLLIFGTVVLIAGFLWPWLKRIPLGHLPGDIIITRPHVTIYIPITTMILISIVLSLLLWLSRKW
ncbi:MAG TPA: DUF2905 domain-containing protein [Thermodesulfobacteriota bacterium]|nr:DUF2905 domain-containing protein [Deltaproteobacteria bacterium]HNR14547.1 DUF2905 domain-containing protein [Thermodesulfobacteriota bacterium]HNU70166.1 DUF2905 domain-containing protein [Thermodesulfobacteriota bacterium]HOC37781.1 DUF2905 domain-containing protein [Thermodesulfobacteriota bacterium]HQO78467.1 DUF2905 domain-containing protein [Thermodesulfobacteriota bacterium]